MDDDEDCLHEEEDFNWIEGTATCYYCGNRRPLTDRDEEFCRYVEAEWAKYVESLPPAEREPT